MRVVHYFAYGSNMNADRVQERGLPVVGASAASLPGLELRFDKISRQHPQCAHANIVYAPGSLVEGVLYELDAPEAIRVMDRFEHAPVNYGRDVVVVESGGRRIAAWTYFANHHARRAGLRPPADYLAHLLAGKPFLSESYHSWLAAHPVAEV